MTTKISPSLLAVVPSLVREVCRSASSEPHPPVTLPPPDRDTTHNDVTELSAFFNRQAASSVIGFFEFLVLSGPSVSPITSLILENAYYSVIQSEACSAILERSTPRRRGGRGGLNLLCTILMKCLNRCR